jgi:N-acetylglutamate synthase-like GNAT family acetyltransferase
MPISIRTARASDQPQVEALIRREVRAGTVLSRPFALDEFIVATEDGHVVGTLAAQLWSDTVIELGTVIAAASGRGIGRALVSGGLATAEQRGADWAVVLTGSPGFFSRHGFSAMRDAPWARALGPVLVPDQPHAITTAVGKKAANNCRSCPQLSVCSQTLLVRRLRTPWEAYA